MEKQPLFEHSLKEIVLRRIAAIVWTEADILTSFQNLRFKLFPDSKLESEWRVTVEKRVKHKTSELPLPESLATQIVPFVRPVGSEILRWKLFHERFLGMWREDLGVPAYKKLFWTAAGSIDYRKTALEFIRFKTLDFLRRYKLACLYCLEDYLPALWKELPEKTKKSICKQENPLLAGEPQLEFCWSHVLKEEELVQDCAPGRRFASPSSFHLRAFESSALRGNKTAVEYFLQKLTPEEKEASVVRTALSVLANRNAESDKSRYSFPKEKLTDVFCYLFFQMTPEQQMEICRSRPFEVLRGFLEWPWQDILSGMVDLFWTYLPESTYDSLLDIITNSMRHSDQYFAKTFRELFPRSPDAFRKKFIDRECHAGFIFPKLFFFNDSASVEVIFRNVDNADKLKLLSSFRFFQHFDHFSLEDNLFFVDLCIREAALPVEDREVLKVVYREFFNTHDQLGARSFREEHWKRVFECLDMNNPT